MPDSAVTPTTQKKAPPGPPPPRDVRLSNRIRLIRNVLPVIIVLVVIAVEFGISQLPSRQAELTAHLLFYGLLGPLVTFFSAEWIAEGRARANWPNWSCGSCTRNSACLTRAWRACRS
nr:hypothetical protein [Deinococcus cavernae]